MLSLSFLLVAGIAWIIESDRLARLIAYLYGY